MLLIVSTPWAMLPGHGSGVKLEVSLLRRVEYHPVERIANRQPSIAAKVLPIATSSKTVFEDYSGLEVVA